MAQRSSFLRLLFFSNFFLYCTYLYLSLAFIFGNKFSRFSTSAYACNATSFFHLQPNMYRLMQISGQPMPGAVKFRNLFHRGRNRVEFISDFPVGNDPEVISSLKIHPEGWVAISRNVSSDENSEVSARRSLLLYTSNK